MYGGWWNQMNHCCIIKKKIQTSNYEYHTCDLKKMYPF